MSGSQESLNLRCPTVAHHVPELREHLPAHGTLSECETGYCDDNDESRSERQNRVIGESCAQSWGIMFRPLRGRFAEKSPFEAQSHTKPHAHALPDALALKTMNQRMRSDE